MLMIPHIETLKQDITELLKHIHDFATLDLVYKLLKVESR